VLTERLPAADVARMDGLPELLMALRDRHPFHRRVALQTGVGHQDVEGAEPGANRVEHRHDLRLRRASARKQDACPPAPAISLAMASALSGMATRLMATAAPAAATCLAQASPMPELAPVTRATWPFSGWCGYSPTRACCLGSE
jgi:hypothetical protein